jgi:hypothetical protein
VTAPIKRGLVLDKIVLLGRTLDEYRRYFALDLEALRGQQVLDVGSGVSSFCAEANAAGVSVTAVDPIYGLPPNDIEPRCEIDLEHVVSSVIGLPTYRWDFYQSPERLRDFRRRAYRTFLHDLRANPARYVPGSLPQLPFKAGQFHLTLCSYLLFAYEEHLGYEFHKNSLLEIMRVTHGEARLYPIVTFEAVRSTYIERLKSDADLDSFNLQVVPTDFEFLLNSNFYLSVTHR